MSEKKTKGRGQRFQHRGRGYLSLDKKKGGDLRVESKNNREKKAARREEEGISGTDPPPSRENLHIRRFGGKGREKSFLKRGKGEVLLGV